MGPKKKKKKQRGVGDTAPMKRKHFKSNNNFVYADA